MRKIILVCPLDWGLGHATRCVPIIRQFLEEGHEVIIGADKNPLAFLRQEFPTLKTITIPGYEVTYGEKVKTLKLFYESIKFFNFIKEEHSAIDKIIDDNNIDMLVSDNRYGLWSKKVESIIITHQLFVKAPLGEKLAHQKIEKLISNFDECWIPDVEGKPNFSGDLSHLKPIKMKYKFIGVLSRFSSFCHTESVEVLKEEYDVIAIISGPEPQRTIFEKLVLEQIQKNKLKAVVVLGKPHFTLSGAEERSLDETNKKEIADQVRNDEHVRIFNHLKTEELYNCIQKSKVVICRAGYSSIMDLAALNKKAILVPTPGQTEQEYLAQYHLEQGNFYSQKQSEFDLGKGLVEVEKC